jgi:hypothetical protein
MHGMQHNQDRHNVAKKTSYLRADVARAVGELNLGQAPGNACDVAACRANAAEQFTSF